MDVRQGKIDDSTIGLTSTGDGVLLTTIWGETDLCLAQEVVVGKDLFKGWSRERMSPALLISKSFRGSYVSHWFLCDM